MFGLVEFNCYHEAVNADYYRFTIRKPNGVSFILIAIGRNSVCFFMVVVN